MTSRWINFSVSLRIMSLLTDHFNYLQKDLRFQRAGLLRGEEKVRNPMLCFILKF